MQCIHGRFFGKESSSNTHFQHNCQKIPWWLLGVVCILSFNQIYYWWWDFWGTSRISWNWLFRNQFSAALIFVVITAHFFNRMIYWCWFQQLIKALKYPLPKDISLNRWKRYRNHAAYDKTFLIRLDAYRFCDGWAVEWSTNFIYFLILWLLRL